jgi:hypothetical protein
MSGSFAQMLIDTTKRARQEAEEKLLAERVAYESTLAAIFPAAFAVFDQMLVDAAKAGKGNCPIHFIMDVKTAGMAASMNSINVPVGCRAINIPGTLCDAYTQARPGIKVTTATWDYILFSWL